MYERNGAPVSVGNRLLTLNNMTVNPVMFVRRMRGGSQSSLLLCDDGNFYIVKTLGNPQGDDLLGAEYLAALLLMALELPVPLFARVVISEDFIDSNPDMNFKVPQQWSGARRPLAGVHFGSRLVGSPGMTSYLRDYLPACDFDRVSNRNLFRDMLVFDVWADNQDGRQAVFSSRTVAGKLKVHFIDHGFMFGSQTEGRLTRGHFRSVYHANFAYEGLIESEKCFESSVARIRKNVPATLQMALETMPAEWYGFDKSRLKDQLMRRLEGIDELLRSYRAYLIERRDHGTPFDPILRRGDRSIPIRV